MSKRTIHFICETCGMDFGMVADGFSTTCRRCESKLDYSGNVSGCSLPEDPLNLLVAAWFFFIGAILNGLFSDGPPTFRLPIAIISGAAILWGNRRNRIHKKALALREARARMGLTDNF